AIFLTNVLTLMPQLRALRPAQGAAQGVRAGTVAPILTLAYVVVWSIAGAVALFKPPLAAVGNGPLGFAFGVVALIAPVWLAIIDHLAYPTPRLRSSDPSRILIACLWSAAVAWAAYSIAAPLRMGQTTGIDLTRGGLAIALG